MNLKEAEKNPIRLMDTQREKDVSEMKTLALCLTRFVRFSL